MLVAIATLSAALSQSPAAQATRLWDGRRVLNPAQLLRATELAHRRWADLLRHSPPDATVVDATAGNGYACAELDCTRSHRRRLHVAAAAAMARDSAVQARRLWLPLAVQAATQKK